jgi:hypothetical protein
MAETRISSTELARTLGDVLGRLRLGGDSFIVEQDGKPVAILGPHFVKGPQPVGEALQAWCEAAPPDADFAELLEEIWTT